MAKSTHQTRKEPKSHPVQVTDSPDGTISDDKAGEANTAERKGRRGRSRLIGAVVVVLLAVIVTLWNEASSLVLLSGLYFLPDPSGCLGTGA